MTLMGERLFLFILIALSFSVQADVFTPEIFTGPNCFNAALRFLNLQNHRRHVLAEEMDFILSTYCSPQDAPIYSITLLRDQKYNRPFHAYVPIDDESVFTKNGMSKKAVPQIQSLELMLSTHSSAYSSYCKDSSCQLVEEHYRCQPLPVFGFENAIDRMLSSRDMMFLPQNHKDFLQNLENLEIPLSECNYFRLALRSIAETFAYANYGSITPEEDKLLKQTSNDLHQLAADFECNK